MILLLQHIYDTYHYIIIHIIIDFQSRDEGILEIYRQEIKYKYTFFICASYMKIFVKNYALDKYKN